MTGSAAAGTATSSGPAGGVTAAQLVAAFETSLVSMQIDQKSLTSKKVTEVNQPQQTNEGEADEASLDVKTRLLMRFVEAMTGRRVALFRISSRAQGGTQAPQNEAAAATPTKPAERATPAPEWGIEIRRETTTTQGEQARFEAEGAVKTQSGKTVEFRLDMMMSRETVVVERFDLLAGNAKPQDPLALSLDADAVSLGEGGTAIDLDADGTNELLPALDPGSVWLVRDLNADGHVTNRSELFGPATGDGFSELAKLDADGNGWIDEGDPAFAQLAIWNGAQGSALEDLERAGIGAISTESAATPFALQNAHGVEAGRIRSTGVWLSEDGEARAVQQVDVLT